MILGVPILKHFRVKANFLLQELTPLWNGFPVQEKKQEVTNLSPFEKWWTFYGGVTILKQLIFFKSFESLFISNLYICDDLSLELSQ